MRSERVEHPSLEHHVGVEELVLHRLHPEHDASALPSAVGPGPLDVTEVRVVRGAAARRTELRRASRRSCPPSRVASHGSRSCRTTSRSRPMSRSSRYSAISFRTRRIGCPRDHRSTELLVRTRSPVTPKDPLAATGQSVAAEARGLGLGLALGAERPDEGCRRGPRARGGLHPAGPTRHEHHALRGCYTRTARASWGSTMQALTGGRFHLGFGRSGPQRWRAWVSDPHDRIDGGPRRTSCVGSGPASASRTTARPGPFPRSVSARPWRRRASTAVARGHRPEHAGARRAGVRRRPVAPAAHSRKR